MKKICRKGHLIKSGKRWLSFLLCVCMIGTMLPVTARAENGSTNTGLCEHHTEHTSECGYVEASEGSFCTFVCDICRKEAEPIENNLSDETLEEQTQEQATDKLITAWQWIDEKEYLDEETGNLALVGATKWEVEAGVAYLDESGNEQTCDSATTVTENDTEWGTSDADTWYVVNGNVTIGSAEAIQRVGVNGNVHLILVDGCTLTVNGGIHVYSGSLTIYGQSTGDDAGRLIVQNVANECAGIHVGSGIKITINGGNITSTGGDRTDINYGGGAGIGGGYGQYGGIITINGGTVTTTGGYYAAGIGGGDLGKGETITINGGTVTATGGYDAAGIGGGHRGGVGTITISGGTISATGNSWGAGIGGGSQGGGGIITISGGTITANGGSGAGIGDGKSGSGGTIAINGGAVMASSISDKSSQESWSGLIFEGNAGKAYGSSSDITTDCTIPSGKTLEVANGQTITIAETATFTNKGTIYHNGSFTGTITNNGTIHNTGKISEILGGTIYNYSIEPTEILAATSATLALKINGSETFDGTVTYTLSANESNAEIENESTLTVTNESGCQIPVTAAFVVNGISMTKTVKIVTTSCIVHSYSPNSEHTQHICTKCGCTESHVDAATFIAHNETHSISASCSLCGAIGTVTLMAPDSLTYDRNKKAATVSGSISGVETPIVTYQTADGQTNLGMTAPADAGTYTASITLGTGTDAATVSVGFTIEQATPVIGTVSAQELNDTLDVSKVQLSRSDMKVSGTLSLKEGTTLQYGTNDYTYVFTPSGTDAVNYKPIEGTVSITVNDTIAPTAEYQIGENGWKKFVNTISFGLFCKDDKTVEITYSDVNASGETGTGVKTKQYYIADKELTEAELADAQWIDYSNAISIDAKGVYFIYVKVEDKAGHSVVLNSEGIVIYAESTLSPASMDYTYKENKDLEVQITRNGNTFGKLTDASGNEIASSNYSIDEAGKLTLKAAYLDTLDVGEYTYKIYMNPQGQTTNTVTLEYSFAVNVKACELTVTGATATNRKYDTTKAVAITAVELSGVKSGDTVSVDTTNLTGTLTSANAGSYTSVTLPTLTLTGTDAGNYKLVQPTDVVPTTVIISKADAQINVGTATYNKTFGDVAFTLSGISDTNPEANVQYAVAAGEDVVSVSNGTVTILKAGSATITVSLPASTNYNAAEDKTITVNVAKKSGYTIADINRSYLYLRNNEDTIDLSDYLPTDCGNVAYGDPQVNGTLYTDGGQPAVSSDGKLSYIVKQASSAEAEGTITVQVTTDNYENFNITVNVKLADKLSVSLKDGSSVTLQNSTLTYGEALSKLAFNSAVFADGDGNVVTGTLAWKTPTDKPNAGTTYATWLFTPNDEWYETVEGTIAITVNKATPVVTAVPTVADRTYYPTVSLTNADLVGGTVNVEGSWSWQTAGTIPTVNNSGYVAVFTPTDTANYETVARTITVTVSKATPYIETAPTAAAITYGDALGTSAFTGGNVQYSDSDATTVTGSFAWEDATTKPTVADSDRTTYQVVFTPSDTVNYNMVKTGIILTVNKAENAPNMPGETMNVGNSCEKVRDVALPEDWVWQDADKDKELTAGTPVTAIAVYDGADRGNYVKETVSVSVTREALPDGLWMEEISDQTYNGKEIKPEVEVYYDGQLLTAGKDYNVFYKNNTNAASADAVNAKGASIAPTVTVKGKGNFAGTVTKTFTIQPLNLDNYETDAQMQELLTIEPVYAKYTGKVIQAAPTVKLNGKTISLSAKQYTCEYNDENPSAEKEAYKDCGTYSITIVGSGRNFVGKTTVTEIISGKLITKANITLDRSSYPYNKETGETFPSSVTVKDGKDTLTEGTHYTVAYKDYDKIGTATVLITGIGDYSGVKIKNYKITGKKLTAGMITQVNKSFVYDGMEHSVVKDTDYTIADGTTILEEGQHYTVTYTGDRTKAGTFKVNFTGIGAYSGTVTKSFTIQKASAQTLDVTLPDSGSVIYTKGGTKPEPEVRFNGELLTEGTDYTVTYKNNTKVASAEDSKAPYLYITGKGNFTGNTKTVPVKFTIVAAPLDEQTIVVDNVSYKNKNNNFVPTVTITDRTTGKKLAKKTDYLGSFTYEIWDTAANTFVPFDGKKVEASEDNIRMRVTVSAAGSYTGQASTEYEICPKSITAVKVEKIPNQEYTGKAITPKLTITDNGKELTEGKDYTLEYNNNTKKGTATVTIRGKGQYGGSRTVKFKITSRIFK